MSHRRAKRTRACLGSKPIAEYERQTVHGPIRLTDKCSRKTYQDIKRRARDDKGTHLPSLKDSHYYNQLSRQ